MTKNPAPEEKKLDSFNYSSTSTKRKRTAFDREQINILIKYFEKDPYPGIEEREELSRLINIHESRIQVWFQNRRARHSTQKTKQLSEASTSTKKRMCLENVSPSPNLEEDSSEQEFATLKASRCPSLGGELSQEAGPRNDYSFERRSAVSTTEAACLYGYDISQSHPFFSSQSIRPSTELQPCTLLRPMSQGSSSQWASSWALQRTQRTENYGSCTFICGVVKPPLHQQQQRWAMGQLHPGYHPMIFQHAGGPSHHLQQSYPQQHPIPQIQQLTPYQHQCPQELEVQKQPPQCVKDQEQTNTLSPSFKQQELHPIDLFKKTVGFGSTLFLPDEHLKASLGDLAAPQGHLTTPIGDLVAPQEHLASSQESLDTPVGDFTGPLGDLADSLEDLTVPLGQQSEIPDSNSMELLFQDALSLVFNDKSYIT